jgi:hypothetical protein
MICQAGTWVILACYFLKLLEAFRVGEAVQVFLNDKLVSMKASRQSIVHCLINYPSP